MSEPRPSLRAERLPAPQHAELGTLPAKIDAFDPRAAVVLICQSGRARAQGCAWLEQRGFQRVYNLGGGIARLDAHGITARELGSQYGSDCSF